MRLKIKMFLCSVIFIFGISILTSSTAMKNYQTVSTPTGFVTATTLNVRQGPRNKFWNSNKSV